MKKKWRGSPITDCQVCHLQIKKEFVDGKTMWGPWGIMCLECHSKVGFGFGLGRGQRYDLSTLVKLEG